MDVGDIIVAYLQVNNCDGLCNHGEECDCYTEHINDMECVGRDCMPAVEVLRKDFTELQKEVYPNKSFLMIKKEF